MAFRLNFTLLNNFVFLYISLRFFTEGLEEFLIQPTAWYYMEYLGGSNVLLGFTLAAYSVGALFFTPFMGVLEMKFQASKATAIICGFVRFSGNLIYSISINGYFPLVGRILSGLGAGTDGVLYGVVAKSTTNRSRAKAFLYFDGIYTIGAILGPTVGSALAFNLDIYGWKINAGNSPALILTFLWFILLVLAILLPRDLPENSEIERSETFEEIDLDDIIENRSVKKLTTVSMVISLYYHICLSMLIYGVLTFYFPLLAKRLFGLGLHHVKLIYLDSTLFVLVLYLSLYLFLEKLSEKRFIILSMIAQLVPIAVTFYCALSWNKMMSVNKTYLLLISMFVLSAQFLNIPVATSLLSKITPVNTASFYQSLTITAVHAGISLSRLTAGVTFDQTAMIYTCLSLTICWCIGFIWMGLGYRNFSSVDNIKVIK